MYHNLPVDFQNYDPNTFIQGLPYSVPANMYFNIPASQGLTQWLPLMAGYLLKSVQDNAHKNCARCFMYNFVTPNYPHNDAFLEMLATTAEYTQMVLARNNVAPQDENRIEQVIANCAEEMVYIFVAIYVSRYPELERTLDHVAINDMNHYLQLAGNIREEIDAFQRSRNAPAAPMGSYQQPMHGYNQPMQHGNFGGGFGGGHHPSQMASGYRPNAMATGSVYGTKPAVPTNAHKVDSSLAFGGSVRHSEPSSPTSNGNVAGHGSNVPKSYMGAFGKPSTEPITASLTSLANRGAQSVRNPHQEVVAKVDKREVKPTEKIVKKGNEGAAFIFSLAHPYPEAYNPKLHRPVLKEYANGIVYQAIVDIEEAESMNYLEHELNPTFVAAVKRDEEDNVDTLRVVTTMKDIVDPLKFTKSKEVVEERTKEAKEKNEDIDPPSVPTILDGTIEASSLRESIGKVENILAENGLDTNSYVEYRYANKTTYTVSKTEYELIQSMLTQAVDDTDTIEAIAGLAKSLYDIKDKVNDRWWYDIQRELTLLVNEVMNSSLPLGWNITAFVDDIYAVRSTLKERHGDEFTQMFFDNIHELVCMHLVTLDYVEIEGTDKVSFTHVVNSSVSRIAIKAKDLAIAMDTKAALVSPERFPMLYKALASIYKRNSMPLRNRYILTQDNVVLRVYNGWLQADAYLLGAGKWD